MIDMVDAALDTQAETISDLKHELASAREEVRTQVAAREAYYHHVEDVRREIADLRSENADLKHELFVARLKIQGLEGRLEFHRNQIS